MKPLTDTQLELVVLIANGMRHEEIAETTHRSVSSVNQTLNVARKRAGANTLAHLVSIVISTGQLVWSNDEDGRVVSEQKEGNALDAPLNSTYAQMPAKDRRT